MAERHQWGTLARGIYVALLWLTPFVHWHYSDYLWYYVAFLVFLGLGLGPLLVATGILSWTQTLLAERQERAARSHIKNAERQARYDAQRAKYKSKRKKDSRLPKNW